MTASNFPVVSSIFGFTVTTISLLAFIINICRSHLPSNKIKVLEALLDETEQFFRNAVEEGLLTEPGFVQETELRIRGLKTRTYGLRSRVYKATSLRQDYAEFLRGTSTAIGSTCQSLKKLRAQVVTSSEEGRRTLTEVNLVLTLLPPALSCSPNSRHYFNRAPVGHVLRPHSCPPTLSTRKSEDELIIPTHKDPVQSGLDVQITDVQDCTSALCTSVALEPEAWAL